MYHSLRFLLFFIYLPFFPLFYIFLLFFHSFLLFPSSHATASFCQSTCQQSSGLYCQFQSKLNEQIFITQFCKKKLFPQTFLSLLCCPGTMMPKHQKVSNENGSTIYTFFCRKRDLAFDNHLIKYDNREEGSI